ncbi:hypothetical protein PGT21_011595 [Puccinia graminis f. sp. tritici]|uniref:Uncharacterized protein n=1 Tax=Puccinia graminis f. sp. tritici TaxID=56615 RepID=A0A5B0PXC1_PUCGR|nr:hypothetical protein PGT21_011595 [Puccinia graminis f. sp. tritici]
MRAEKLFFWNLSSGSLHDHNKGRIVLHILRRFRHHEPRNFGLKGGGTGLGSPSSESFGQSIALVKTGPSTVLHDFFVCQWATCADRRRLGLTGWKRKPAPLHCYHELSLWLITHRRKESIFQRPAMVEPGTMSTGLSECILTKS